MLRSTIALTVLLLAMPAWGQQPVPQGTNPEFLQHALNVLQAQRNRALDEAASAEAQLAQAQKTIADLQKQVMEKPKVEAPKP